MKMQPKVGMGWGGVRSGGGGQGGCEQRFEVIVKMKKSRLGCRGPIRSWELVRGGGGGER